jgi:hypothetical protein
MSCIPYYPIQFFRSPKEQSKVLLESLFKGLPNDWNIEEILDKDLNFLETKPK